VRIRSEHIFPGGGLSFKSNSTNINIDKIISALEKKTAWQQLKTTDMTLDQKSYFTFLRDSQKYLKKQNITYDIVVCLLLCLPD
jgi:hypothetical protein